MHKFKFLDDDMNGSEGNDSGSSVPSTGLCEKTSTWDYDDGEDGLITGSSMGSFSGTVPSSSSGKRFIYDGNDDDDDDLYGSYPDRKRRKE